MTEPTALTPDTIVSVPLPIGVWQLLRVGLDHVPVARAVTDQAIAALEAEYRKAVAELLPPPPPPQPLAEPPQPKKAPRK